MYLYNVPQSGAGTVTITGQAADGSSGSIQVGIGYTPLQVASSNPTIQPGQSYTLTASGGTPGLPYLWWVTGGGTVTPMARNSATATYTAPGTVNESVNVMVCQPDTGAFGTTVLQLPPYLQLQITSSSSTIAPGGTCTLTVSGGESGVAYRWEAVQGTVESTGQDTALYTAPAVFQMMNPVTVSAGQNGSVYGFGMITLQKASG